MTHWLYRDLAMVFDLEWPLDLTYRTGSMNRGESVNRDARSLALALLSSTIYLLHINHFPAAELQSRCK